MKISELLSEDLWKESKWRRELERQLEKIFEPMDAVDVDDMWREDDVYIACVYPPDKMEFDIGDLADDDDNPEVAALHAKLKARKDKAKTKNSQFKTLTLKAIEDTKDQGLFGYCIPKVDEFGYEVELEVLMDILKKPEEAVADDRLNKPPANLFLLYRNPHASD